MRRTTRPRLFEVLALGAVLATLTACGASGDSKPAATPISDSGFEVVANGFSFRNYTNEDGFENLGADTMQALFGDQVCVRMEGDTCILYPVAQTWMKSANDAMNGGHCFGMAGLSVAMFGKQIDPKAYGGADAGDLKIANNPALQRELAGVYATQFTKPTSQSKQEVTAMAAIDTLEKAWGEGKGYVLAFYQLKDGEQTAGHAITPIAVRDQPTGKKAIIVYDNNFPREPQKLLVDPKTDTWTYSTAANPDDDPDVYKGGANNMLQLYPVDPMLGTQACPFCNAETASESSPAATTVPSGGAGSPVGGSTMVFLNQKAGHRGVQVTVGDGNGRPVPGQESISPLLIANPQTVPDIELVPNGQPFTVRIDGTHLKKPAIADVTIVGPGSSYAVNNIDMQPGQVDIIRFDPGKRTLDYLTKVGSAPDIVLGLDHPDASYRFLFGGLKLGKGGTIEVGLDPEKQRVFASSGHSGKSSIDFQLKRITDTSDESAASEPIPLRKGESIIVEYGKWQGNGQPVPIGIDKNGDGTSDEALVRDEH